MYWFNKEDLLYYHPNTGDYCYCELLIEPNDLMLQRIIPKVSSAVNIFVEAYSPDGNTFVADITPYFKGIVAVDTAGRYYVNVQLQAFPPELCSYGCFVLKFRVRDVIGGTAVYVVDNIWTQQYCIDDCCSGIGQLEAGTGDQKDVYNASSEVSTNNCGKPLVRIKSTFPCIDNYTGDYYGAAITRIQGVYNDEGLIDYPFYKITNLQGLFKRTPREVQSKISLNCKVQKTESTRRWMLQGSQPVPQWKMDELEGQFLSNKLLVNGNEYRMPTNVPFEKIKPYQKEGVAEFFRLETVLEECRIWQIFGCTPNCINLNAVAYAPLKTTENLFKVFDSNGALIALDQSTFITYLLSQDGIYAVTDVSYVYTAYGYSSVLMIESENGYIPPYFYLNYVGANSKWFMVSEVEDLFNPCAEAVLGTITDMADICDAAMLGTVTDAAASQLTDIVYDFGQWLVEPGSNATLINATVRLVFISRAALLANSQAALAGDIVGYVIESFVPSVERVLTANLPADTYVIIGTDGTIRWFGALTDSTPSYGEVEFINVTYLI